MASIYQRGEIWWISYLLDGELIKRSLKTRIKSVATLAKARLENDIDAGSALNHPSKARIDSLLTQYINHCKTRLEESTWSDYEAYLGKFFKDCQVRTLRDINARMFESYLDKRIDNGISKNTANHIIRYVKAFLNFCVRGELIPSNPLASVKQYRLPKKPPVFLSKDEINTLFIEIQHLKIEPIIRMAIYTGMRKQELKDFDPSNVKHGKIHIQGKGDKFRAIPVHPKIKDIVKKPLDWTNFRKEFEEIRCIEGFENITMHKLRHSFASALVISGIDLVTLKELMGHSKIETSLIYSHLSPNHLKDSLEGLNFD